MAKNYFNRYVWLIDTINRAGHISLRDLSAKWERSSMNDDGEPLAERTFHNHRIAIEDTFGIEIKCYRSLGYYISNEDDIESGAIRQWMLESLSLSNMLNETRDMRDRILFEEIPSGKKWLSVIVNAMRDGKAIEMTYHSFWRDEQSTFIAHPWCLKLFKQRWYVLALSEGHKQPRIYALDERMLAISQTDEELKKPAKFNAREYFRNYFGITVSEDCKPEVIRLKVDANQANYFKSLPLHPSQKLVESNGDFSVFEYFLAPTFDFKQEVLRNSPMVEVLSPESFRQEVIEDLRATLSLYGVK